MESQAEKKIKFQRLVKFWATVVEQAIVDSCVSPPKKTRNIPDPLSIDGIEYLFGDPALVTVLLYLDIDPARFRTRLLSRMYDEAPTASLNEFGRYITDAQRRAFRFNYQWYQRHGGQVAQALETTTT